MTEPMTIGNSFVSSNPVFSLSKTTYSFSPESLAFMVKES